MRLLIWCISVTYIVFFAKYSCCEPIYKELEGENYQFEKDSSHNAGDDSQFEGYESQMFINFYTETIFYFNIQSIYKMYTCDVSGTAYRDKNDINKWTFCSNHVENGCEDSCKIQFSFKESVCSVESSNCREFCGLNGNFDGLYYSKKEFSTASKEDVEADLATELKEIISQGELCSKLKYRSGKSPDIEILKVGINRNRNVIARASVGMNILNTLPKTYVIEFEIYKNPYNESTCRAIAEYDSIYLPVPAEIELSDFVALEVVKRNPDVIRSFRHNQRGLDNICIKKSGYSASGLKQVMVDFGMSSNGGPYLEYVIYQNGFSEWAAEKIN